MSFKARLTKPEAGNKYYIRKVSGGYNPCIQGRPLDAGCNVLANCVGYAVGRFNEIGNWGLCKYLGNTNAERMLEIATKQGLSISQTPSLGACMVWQKGATLSGSDGEGHVCIVESVISDTEVKTSESGYDYKAFYSKNRTKGSDGNWGQKSEYKFRGFICNPAVDGSEPTTTTTEVKKVNVTLPVIKKGVKCDAVKAMQALLNFRANAGLVIDGSCGPASDAAIRAFQKSRGLAVDGSCGPATWRALIGD